MTGPDRPDHGLVEQPVVCEAPRRVRRAGHGSVGFARVQVLEQPFSKIDDAHLDKRGGSRHSRHHVGQQHGAGVGSRRNREPAMRRRRLEGPGRERGLEASQRGVQLRTDFACARRGPHAAGAADEQLVAERVTQAVERMTDGGLSKAQARAGARDAALFEQGVEDPQQVEIQRSEMHFVHFSRDDISFCTCRGDTYLRRGWPRGTAQRFPR